MPTAAAGFVSPTRQRGKRPTPTTPTHSTARMRRSRRLSNTPLRRRRRGRHHLLPRRRSKTFAVGAYGGSLGYAQMTAAGGATDTNGMNGGYIGLGIDEYGNYSTANEGKIGGFGTGVAQGSYPNAVAVAARAMDLSATTISAAPDSFQRSHFLRPSLPALRGGRAHDSRSTSPRRINSRSSESRRHAANSKNSTTSTFPGSRGPDQLIMGFTAGTGGLTNIHEIQGLQALQRRCESLGSTAAAQARGPARRIGTAAAARSQRYGADLLLNNAVR